MVVLRRVLRVVCGALAPHHSMGNDTPAGAFRAANTSGRRLRRDRSEAPFRAGGAGLTDDGSGRISRARYWAESPRQV